MRLTLLKYLITRVIGRDESTILPLHVSQPPRDNKILNFQLSGLPGLPELPGLPSLPELPSLPIVSSLPPVPIFVQKCFFVCKCFALELHYNVWLVHNFANFPSHERMIILDNLSSLRDSDQGRRYEDAGEIV
ncbi:hypothetical protein E4U33_005912 [Claviceps sp. LM78 group G4]|nr:hypothetical protein E4U33_005912 [Claviceps sp. LM78 group G4]